MTPKCRDEKSIYANNINQLPNITITNQIAMKLRSKKEKHNQSKNHMFSSPHISFASTLLQERSIATSSAKATAWPSPFSCYKVMISHFIIMSTKD